MASTRRRTRRKNTPRKTGGATPSAARRDLNAASRALLGRDEEQRAYRPRPLEDASIEDALQDWPEES